MCLLQFANWKKVSCEASGATLSDQNLMYIGIQMEHIIILILGQITHFIGISTIIVTGNASVTVKLN